MSDLVDELQGIPEGWIDRRLGELAAAEILRLREQLAEAVKERDELRAEIGGRDRKMLPEVTHGQYREMAYSLHQACNFGQSRIQELEARNRDLEAGLRVEQKLRGALRSRLFKRRQSC